ncbi:MAG TPA: PAS domain-containing protein [Puia sp.]|nr:PAS domain-containing protein [Puia sp.]
MIAKPNPVINGINKTRYLGKPISEIITNGFFTVDREWTVKYWNKAAEKLLRVSAEEIIGKNLWEEFAGAVPIDFYTAYHLALIQDIPLHFEEYWGAMETWFEVNTYHADDSLSVSFKSRSEPVQSGHSERQLKTLNELYQFVTEVTNDCLWEWDFGTRELFWIDGGHKRVFGYQIVNAIIPQSFWEKRIHPDDRLRILKRLEKILTTGTETSWEEEYRFQRIDGSYAYVHDRGHIIYGADMVASRMVGATQDVTARKLAETGLLESESKLVKERLARQQEMTHAVLAAQEQERSEIGKELHDNLNQILGAAKLYIELAKTDEENREMCLEKSSGFIVKVIEEIRRISKTLSTPSMVMGILESIKILVDDLAVVNEIKIEFQDNGIDDTDLDEKLQLTIFRIVQEQLNNILKHANATHAIIDLNRRESRIILRISDNGNGCSISEEEKGVGNINIKSRAEQCHGTVAMTSSPGKGYELKVELPLEGYL